MFVIIVLFDGPAHMKAFGDREGKPFTSREAAETAMQKFRRRGVSWSVYVAALELSP